MTIVEILKQIHDEADHIVNTETEGFEYREVAMQDACEIKRLAKEVIKRLEGG